MRRFAAMTAVILSATFAISCSAGVPVPKSRPLAKGKFVTVSNKHFRYNGKRIRFWGACYCSSTKQSIKNLDLCFDRMVDAGFNIVRYNLSHRIYVDRTRNDMHHVVKTVKGSDSQMDRMDYSLYCAKQRGMFFWILLDHYRMGLKPGDYDVLPDDGTREQWVKWAKKVAPSHHAYVDDRVGAAYIAYAKNLLNHVNPYTNKRWADEEAIAMYEMGNENKVSISLVTGSLYKSSPDFVKRNVEKKWNAWLKQTYRTDAALKKVWGKLEKGESLAKGNIAYAPIAGSITKVMNAAGYQPEYIVKGAANTKYPQRRGQDIVAFGYWLFKTYNDKFIREIRSIGKPGVGVSVVPITHSGHFGRQLTGYYAQSQYDYSTYGIYGFVLRPWEVAKSNPYYPYVTRVNAHPVMGQPIDVMRVKDKPYLIYEVNDHGPDPYHVEFPLRFASLISHQNSDGACWFHWDLDSWMPALNTDNDYANSPICMPAKAYPNAVLAFCNDEVKVAAIKSAGAIFLTGAIPPAANPRHVVIGKDRLLTPPFNVIGDAVEWQMRHYAWREGLVVSFDPTKKTTKIPPAHPHWRSRYAQMGPYVKFDWSTKKGTQVINSPQARAIVGFYGPDAKIGDLTIKGVDQEYSSITFVAEDGKPLTNSGKILATFLSTSHNTGVKIDPSIMKRRWARGAADATVARGSLPVINYRLSAKVSAPWLVGKRYYKYSFDRKCYDSGTVGKSFSVSKDEPLFYVKFLRSPRRFRKMVVAGNSITHHSAYPKIKWDRNNGMAATSPEKDFAHQLQKLVAKAQGGKRPKLIIENLLANAMLNQTAKFKKIAAHKADLIIIQTGDNLAPDKANMENLGKPYEEMLKIIRAANPRALIVGVSTWGGGANRDPMMRWACGRQAVPFVEATHLIRDAKNRAVSEGHFTNGGVNWHPGDRGMKALAEEIWKVVDKNR